MIKFAKKAIGANAEQILNEYTYFSGNKEAREKHPRKFQNRSTSYFKVMEKAVRKNQENIYKLMGLEKGVEHFFANKTKGKGNEGKYTTAYSPNSKIYKKIYNRLYKEDIEGNLRMKLLLYSRNQDSRKHFRKPKISF